MLHSVSTRVQDCSAWLIQNQGWEGLFRFCVCVLDCIQPFISPSSHYDSPGASARRHHALSASSNTCPALRGVPRGPVPYPSTVLSSRPLPGPCQSQSGHPRLQLPHGAGQRQLWQGKHSRHWDQMASFFTHNQLLVISQRPLMLKATENMLGFKLFSSSGGLDLQVAFHSAAPLSY